MTKLKRKLLLTGGGGMVGRNLLEHPAASLWEIDVPNRERLDLSDFNATCRYIDEAAPDVIVHAAGYVGGIHANIAQPVDFLIRNADMGRNLVLAARSVGIRQLLNLGSSCMYPREGRNPLTEDQILSGELEPTNEGYAIAKIFTAKLCEYVSRETTDLIYKTVIPCNLYGRYDKFDPSHSHLVAAVIAKMHEAKIQKKKVVDIWGDGQARREFMYAGDLADAIFHVLNRFDMLPPVCNIGLGHDYTVNEYYEAIAAVVGWSGRFTHDLSRPVGMRKKLVDVSKQTALGWMPQTALIDGLRNTYRHYLEDVIQ